MIPGYVGPEPHGARLDPSKFGSYVDMTLDETLKALRQPLAEPIFEALRKAYETGFIAGEAAMKAKFRELVADPQPTQRDLPMPSKKDAAGRVIRGSVGKVIAQVLRSETALKASEVEQKAVAIDPAVAAKSVGNELRRFKDLKYRRDDEGRWSLISN